MRREFAAPRAAICCSCASITRCLYDNAADIFCCSRRSSSSTEINLWAKKRTLNRGWRCDRTVKREINVWQRNYTSHRKCFLKTIFILREPSGKSKRLFALHVKNKERWGIKHTWNWASSINSLEFYLIRIILLWAEIFSLLTKFFYLKLRDVTAKLKKNQAHHDAQLLKQHR